MLVEAMHVTLGTFNAFVARLGSLSRTFCRVNLNTSTARLGFLLSCLLLLLCSTYAMSSSLQSATYRCCQLATRTQKRSLSSQCLRLSSTSSANQQRRHNSLKQSRRWQSTDAAAAPTNPKIAGIVDQISQLTLLETADLVASLKVCSMSRCVLLGFFIWS